MSGMDLGVVLAEWQLGLLRSDALPGVATEMLVLGYESPAVVELAGVDLGPFDPRDASDLWATALSELDLDLPSSERAVLTLACPIAREVVEGRLDPIVGARQIVVIGQHDPDVGSLVADFVYPADVFGYYEHEPGLSWWTRRRGLQGTKRMVRQACEALVERCIGRENGIY
ncbi:MAG: hypothetical protein GY701_26690 [Sulfitobacter sp.]|nr:hypothetical protein [Sulfitobacter sp.]